MPTGILFLLAVLFYLPNLSSATHYHHHRRLLHQPFFPLDSFPPTQPPSSSPLPQPQLQQPKLPFSSSSSTPQNPFFPSYRASPPPPTPTALATFPANISTLLFPQPTSPHHTNVLAVALPVSLLSAALVAALAAFLYYRRNRAFNAVGKASRADSLRLYPPNIPPSDGGYKPRSISNRSSEFLYLGTLVNSRGIDEETVEDLSIPGVRMGVSSSSPQNMGSPELKPLPPLPRHNFTQTYRSSEAGSSKNDEDDDEEEFFSPRGSSGGKENLSHTGSTSRRVFQSMEADDYVAKSFNLRSPSYPSSKSASPILSASNSPSPPQSILSPPSFKSKSPDSFISFPGPLRPLPPRPIQLSALSSSSSSAASSPAHEGSGTSQKSPSRNSEASVQENQSPTRIKLFPKQSVPIRLPPPPPPFPPPKFWEIPITSGLCSEPNSGPPVLVTPSRPVGFQNLTPISPSEHAKTNGTTEMNEETPKPKLKPLHWDKVRASSDHVMVWDQIKSSSFQLNEEMIETLFTVNNSKSTQNDNGVRRQVLPSSNQENRVLDQKKSQNIAILLRALNVTVEEVCEGLSEGNADTLGAELLESLLKMAPTKEEERKLKEFKDESPFKLGPAEKFLKAVLDVPFAFKRVDAMLYIANFDSEIEYLKRSFEILEAACKELRSSRMFLKLLEAVLKTGNRMNVGTNRGDAHAFKLDTLLKLVDIKGTDGKTTLLHFVVQEIIRAEGFRLSGTNQSPASEKTQPSSFSDDVVFRKLGLQVVSSLSGELSNVKKAAAMDSDVLSNEVAKLAGGISKIVEVMKLNEDVTVKTSGFSESLSEFLRKAEEEIVRVKGQESVALSMVKEITEYFHGNSAKEEAHPYRIFLIVRDFLSILDHVCKEVGKINERTIVGSARPFSAPVNPIVQLAFPGVPTGRHHCGSSDDESASSS